MRDIHFPGRSVVASTGAMVATSQPMATQTALEILRAGGNAMDAAVAASAVLAVTEPFSTGVGGDCFLLFYDATSGELSGLNGSGRSPERASLETFRGRGHTQMPETGILSVTVPGAIHAWETALSRFGRMSFADVLAPAIRYAAEGYALTPIIAAHWRNSEALLRASEDAARCFLRDGRAPRAGAKHTQPELARTLELVAEQGAAAFYQGPVADAIVRFSDAQGGLLGLDDFASHASDWVEPIASEYRGSTVYEIPPNGQGITALMTLNILEQVELGTYAHLGPDHVHLLCAAFNLAVAERDRYVCDPSFQDVPVRALLSKTFAAAQYRRIDPEHAFPDPVESALAEQSNTVYLTVVDEQRNAVSFINSLYHGWGSGLVAGDTGVMLQNRSAGFNLVEGHVNCVAPGKRPLHTIIPAMVFKDDRPSLSFGVMGGFYQAMGQAYVLSNWLDFGMDLQEALDAPRFLPEEGMLQVERGVSQATRAELVKRGHRVRQTDEPLGGGQCIAIDWDEGVLQAGSDPRKDGCALGY